jgi:hypothetical protein
MTRNKKDAFRKVIRQADLQTSADDMATMVMKQITADTADEVAISIVLKSLLAKHGADSAPLALTSRVMAQINPQPAQTAYAPLISKKAWYSAAAMIGLLIVLSLLGGPPNHASNRFVDSTVKHINTMPSVYIIALSFCGVLLLTDHFITSRLKLNKH